MKLFLHLINSLPHLKSKVFNIDLRALAVFGLHLFRRVSPAGIICSHVRIKSFAYGIDPLITTAYTIHFYKKIAHIAENN